tara:strand:- start:1340 stop:1573 length:234 start_codon:yes stop_codon:yes gene_type:complete
MADIKEKHGWISEKQASIMKNCISINKKYDGPYKIFLNENGEEVRVTTVSENKDDHGCKFSDMTYVGIVTQYLRSEH